MNEVSLLQSLGQVSASQTAESFRDFLRGHVREMIHSERYPLSPAILIGHVIAWPSLPVTCSSVPLRRSMSEVFSWACHGVISK
jgi:hypothetical protein